MSEVDVSTEVKQIVSEILNIKEEEIEDDSTFESLGADSIDVVEIIMAAEEHFIIEIPDEDCERIETFSDLVQKIEELR